MKRFFNEDDRYTDEAMAFEKQCAVYGQLSSIVVQWVRDGYSARDMGVVLHAMVDEIVLGAVLSRREIMREPK